MFHGSSDSSDGVAQPTAANAKPAAATSASQRRKRFTAKGTGLPNNS